MKTIEVVAAIIIKNKQVLATQRGYGEWQGWWEFPGGKIESGESPQAALKREIKELEADISVGDLLQIVDWDYPTFHLTMHCFICTLESDSLYLNEHKSAIWLAKETLDSVQWLPADTILLNKISQYI